MSEPTAIISFADQSFAAFRGAAWPRQHAYAQRHGYAWRGYTVRRTDRPASWNKIILIQESLREYRTVWWMDADAAPVDADKPLPDFEADITLARDDNGYNCGVIGCRASEAMMAFLDAVWGAEEWIDHPWWEQAAIQALLPNSGLAVCQLAKSFNAYPHEPDPVILHCPAMPLEHRLEHLHALPPAPALPQIGWQSGATGWRATTAMDPAHISLIYGLILASKPSRILELGVGTGACTRAILESLAYNSHGHLTAVDNWLDWGGRRPTLADELAQCGVAIIETDESAFLSRCRSDSYDFLVSDADHFSGDVANQLRILTRGGVALFHDTNAAHDFPALQEVLVAAQSMTHCHFVRKSRPDEQCDRGLLMIIKS